MMDPLRTENMVRRHAGALPIFPDLAFLRECLELPGKCSKLTQRNEGLATLLPALASFIRDSHLERLDFPFPHLAVAGFAP